MVVNVVPITRLRRATTWWSYRVPGTTPCSVGSLVRIPFRGGSCLGIVWNTEDTTDIRLKDVEAVLTSKPLLRAPQRALVEWMSEYGLCSLSSALHAFMPAALRVRTTRGTEALLREWDSRQIGALEMAERKQHAVMSAGRRDEAERQLAAKYAGSFALLTSETAEVTALREWLAIADGEIRVGIGRERALFAPWLNLRHLTLLEPEDVAYYHEQVPYLDMAAAALRLGAISNAEITVRSSLPQAVAGTLWEGRVSGTASLASVEVIDLRRDSILGKRLLELIRETLEAGKQVIVLHNAHDRPILKEDGSRVVIPGIETVSKRIAAALGRDSLPAGLTVGTRAILRRQFKNIGLTVALSLDGALNQEAMLERLHAWSDLGRLLSLGGICVTQTRQPEHPLITSLAAGEFERYCLTQLAEAKTEGAPPFAERIILSVPADKEVKPAAAEVSDRLRGMDLGQWQASHPFTAIRHTKETLNILIHAPSGTRVPKALFEMVSALPSPWKAQRNPWYGI